MTIEEDHKRQFEYINKHDIKVGTKIKLKNGDILEITFINSHYGWFGNEGNQININDILNVER